MLPIAVKLGFISTMLLVLRPGYAQEPPLPQALNIKSWPAGIVEKSALPKARVLEYAFDDVKASDIEEWLSWLGVKLPVDVSGSFTGWLWAQRSERGWFNFAGYRIEGQITSPTLRIENWEFRQAQLRFGFSNNRWYIGRLAGEVASVGNPTPVGRTEFAATMSQSPPRLLEIYGEIDQTRIEELLSAFGVDFEVENDAASVRAAASVPLAAIDVPGAWQATATLDVQGVQSELIPRSGLTAQLSVRDGQWQLNNARLTIIDQTVTFSGQGEIESNLPFTASFDGRRLSIPRLLQAGKQSTLVPRFIGTMDIVGRLRGDAQHGLESASAAIRSELIRIDGEYLRDVLIESVVDNRSEDSQSIAVEIKSASIAGGKLSGDVKWNRPKTLVDLVPDAARVNVSGVDLAQLPRTLVPVPLFGIAAGQVDFSASRDEAGAAIRWTADGELITTRFAVLGVNVGDADLKFDKPLDSDKLQVQLSAADETVQVQADVYLQEARNFPGTVQRYTATGAVRNYQTQLPLPSLDNQLPLSVSGNFALNGEFSNWLKSGNAEISQLLVQLDEQPLALNGVLLNIREDAFRLERFTLRDARGRAAGSALLRRDGRGQHLLNLRVVGMDIKPYVMQFAPSKVHGLKGTIDFETRLQKRAEGKTELLSGWSGTFVGDIEDVEYRSIPLGQLTVRGTVDDSRISGTALGSVLGGDMRLSGDVKVKGLQIEEDLANGSSFTAALTGIQLNRLMSLAAGTQLGKRYSGTATIEIESGVREGEHGLHIHLWVPIFAYERQEIADDLFAELQFVDGVVLVKEMHGGLAGGRIDLSGDLQVADGQGNGELQFTISRAQLNGIIALLFPEYADNYAGVVTYRGRAQLRDELTLTGTAHFTDVLLYQLPIQDVRSDLVIGLSPMGELLSVSARNAHGTALGGRFDGEAVLRGGAKYKLAAQGKIGHGKVDQLSRALGFEHIIGTGSFDAAARLSSADAGNLAALTGPLRMEFEGGDAQSVPILSDVGRLVPIVNIASTEITSGTLHGQVGQGQFRISDLILNSEAYWLVARGSASLTTKRLDFEALLQTGGGLDDRLLQSGSQKLLALALPQLALLTSVNQLISNRSIYFHIGGTTKHPVIQPRAAQVAAKLLVQSVARQLLVVPVATSGQAAGEESLQRVPILPR